MLKYFGELKNTFSERLLRFTQNTDSANINSSYYCSTLYYVVALASILPWHLGNISDFETV